MKGKENGEINSTVPAKGDGSIVGDWLSQHTCKDIILLQNTIACVSKIHCIDQNSSDVITEAEVLAKSGIGQLLGLDPVGWKALVVVWAKLGHSRDKVFNHWRGMM